VYASEQSNYKDGLYTEQWMAAQCGITDLQSILPEHWRERYAGWAMPTSVSQREREVEGLEPVRGSPVHH